MLIAAIVWQRGTLRAAEGTNTVLEPLAGLFVACLLIVLARRPAGHVLGSRPLVFIGTISYSIYLLHAPLLQLIWQYGMRPAGLPLHTAWSLGVLLVVGLPASIAAGRGFFWLVERHCLGRRPQQADSRTTAIHQTGRAT